MKKLFALMLALVMMLTASFALADTVTIEFKTDFDVFSRVLPKMNGGREIPAEQMAQIKPIFDLLNKMNVKISTEGQAAQLDLNIGETTAISVAGKAAEDNSILVGSSIIPSYLFKITEDDMKQLMQQLPGGAAALNLEAMQKIAEKLSGYLMKAVPAFQAAITPGTPESGSFSFEGYTFDTKTPINVDTKAIGEAVKALVTDIVSDQEIMGFIGSISGQANLDPQQAINNINEAMSEEKMPDVTVDVYTITGQQAPFYAVAVATDKASSNTVCTFKMISREDGSIKADLEMPEAKAVITLEGSQNGILIEVKGQEEGQYVAFAITPENAGGAVNGVLIDVCIAEKTPCFSVRISYAQGEGAVTVNLDEAGKNVLGLMEVMQDQTGEKLQGVQQEAMGGLFQLMAIPEIASLMALLTTTTGR